jgi:hypothetical protein
VTFTPLAVSTAPLDVQIIATYQGVAVAQGNLTVVNVVIPPISNADTPYGLPNRIPPTANTPLTVNVTPNLTGSGQKVTLAKANYGGSNGDFTINGSSTLDLYTTAAVNFSGTTQTAPTGGAGGGNAGNLNVVVQVRGENTVWSPGFSVAAIPTYYTEAYSATINDGTYYGLQVLDGWTSDSGDLSDLDQSSLSEQVQVLSATGVLAGIQTDPTSYLPANAHSLDRHTALIAILTGPGTSLTGSCPLSKIPGSE